jgi:riboflavin transporter FmnP
LHRLLRWGTIFLEVAMSKRMNTARITYVGMMVSLSVILSYFPEIPLAFFAPWLKLDFSFVPMMLVGFSMGPVASVFTLGITMLFHGLGSTTGWVGELANLLMGLAFLLPGAIIYQKKRTKSVALWSMLAGTILMSLVAMACNRYILIPLYGGEAMLQSAGRTMTSYILFAILPFNLLKGAVNSFPTFILYKRLSIVLREAEKKTDASCQ